MEIFNCLRYSLFKQCDRKEFKIHFKISVIFTFQLQNFLMRFTVFHVNFNIIPIKRPSKMISHINFENPKRFFSPTKYHHLLTFFVEYHNACINCIFKIFFFFKYQYLNRFCYVIHYTKINSQDLEKKIFFQFYWVHFIYKRLNKINFKFYCVFF